MDREVVEVVARIGDTILDVAHVADGEIYRFGAWALPLQLHRSQLQVGLVTFTTSRLVLRVAELPRPRFDRRPPAYLLGSLAVHLVVCAVALTQTPFERIVIHPERPRFVLVHAGHAIDAPSSAAVDKSPRAPAAKPARAASNAATRRPPRASDRDGIERPTGHGAQLAAVGAAVEQMASIVGPIDVAASFSTSAGYLDVDARNRDEFGGPSRWDPTKRREFSTVKAGRYPITSAGQVVLLCTATPCEVQAGDSPALRARLGAISACLGGDPIREIAINLDGTVDGVEGQQAACIAKVAAR